MVMHTADKVRFPISDPRLLFNDRRALFNIDTVRYLSPPFLLAVILPSLLSTSYAQLTVQIATVLLVLPYVLVYPLVAHLDSHAHTHRTTDLFGRILLAELLLNVGSVIFLL